MPLTFKRNRRRFRFGRCHRCVEQLETRTLLSIAPVQLELAGPYNVAGTKWTYNFTVNGAEADNGFVATAVGPATFPAPNGVSCYEIDYTTPAATTKNYFGVSNGDYVNYGNIVPNGPNTNTTVNGTPYNDIFGVSASASMTVNGSYTANSTITNASGATLSTSTSQVTTSSTLQSETPAPITVLKVSYQAYMFISTTTDAAAGSVDTMKTWVVPNIGMVQEMDTVTAGTRTSTYLYQLSSFQTTQERLVFMPPPANASANTPIPTTVELLGANGLLDTTSTDTVALSLNVVSGGTGAQLSGTTSLALAGGYAQFTASNGPTINAAGVYTLTATDTNTSAGVASTTSTQFGVVEDHLVIKKQPPKEVDVLQPIPLTVELVNSKGDVDTTVNTDQAQLSLQTVKDGQGAQLAGTTTLTFTKGVAEFAPNGVVSTAANGPNITGVGTFQLLVSVLGANAAASQVTTDEIETKGYELKPLGRLHPLISANPGVDFASEYLVATGQDILPGTFVVTRLFDPEGKPVGGSLPDLSESLNAVEGDGQIVGNTTVSADSGSKYAGPYQINLDVTSPGVYTFTISGQDTDGEAFPASAITPLKIGPVDVESSLLKVSTYPQKFVYANANLEISTGLTTAEATKGKGLYTGFAPTQSVGVSVSLSSSTASGVLNGPSAFALQSDTNFATSGFASYQLPTTSEAQISEPGAYQLTFTEVITPGGQPFDPNNFSPLAGATTIVRNIIVLPDKVKYSVPPPRSLSVGQTFPVSVVLTDDQNNALSSFDNTPDVFGYVLAIQLTATTTVAGGGSALQNAAPSVFTDGVATFGNLSFSTSGKYLLVAKLVLYNSAGDNGAGITIPLGSSQAISRGILVSGG